MTRAAELRQNAGGPDSSSIGVPSGTGDAGGPDSSSIGVPRVAPIACLSGCSQARKALDSVPPASCGSATLIGKLSGPPAAAQGGGSLSLKVNFSWTLAGNLIQAACRYGMLLLLVYFCSLAAAGRYALAVALVAPIWSLVFLGLRAALITDARNQYSTAEYMAVRLIASGVGLIVVAVAVVATDCHAEMAMVVGLVVAARLFEGVSDILHGRLQQRERMDRVAIGLALRGMLGLALMAVAGLLGGGTPLLVAALPVATGLTLIAWDLPSHAAVVRQHSAGRRDAVGLWREPLRPVVLGRLSLVTLPIAATAFLVTVFPELPKYTIAAIHGEQSVAVYTLIAYWITLGMMVVMALGNTVTPRLAIYHAGGQRRAFSRLLGRLVLGVSLMGIAGVAVVAGLGSRLGAILGPEFSEAPRFALALSGFAAMLYLTGPLGRALCAMRRFWALFVVRAVGGGVALVLLPGFVARRGLVGAAEAMLISMGVIVVMLALVVGFELFRPAHAENTVSREAVA